MRPDARRLVRSVAGLSAALVLSVTMISSSSNGSRFAEVIVAALLITSIWDPARGLLAIAVLAPFQSLLPFLPLQPLVLAFLVGWLARQPASLGPRVPAVSAGAAWLLSGFVVASVLMARAITIPAIAILEGMGVAIAVVELFRRRPVLGVQLPMALCASMTIVALFALIGRIGVPSLGYFAMMLCVAGGMTLRDQGSARVLWVVVVLAMLGGCVKFFLQPAAARFDMADTPWVGTALILLFAAGALVQAYHGIVAS
ncbi:MAG TPA: hypothetical protein VGJ29_13015, partial [Vicinamibacterales bacterium]